MQLLAIHQEINDGNAHAHLHHDLVAHQWTRNAREDDEEEEPEVV